MQEVHRHRLRIQLPQFIDHVDDIVSGLAHADDHPAAQFHSGLMRNPQRLEAVVVRVRRTDLGIVPPACVEVVIDPVDPRLGKNLCLVRLEQSQARTEVQPQFFLDLARDRRDVVHLAIARAASTGDDAVRAAFDSLALRAPSSSVRSLAIEYRSIGASEITD